MRPCAGPFEVEIGPVGVGRPAAGGADALGGLGAKRRFQGAVVAPVGRRADVVMQQELAVGCRAPTRVSSAWMFSRIGVSFVPVFLK